MTNKQKAIIFILLISILGGATQAITKIGLVDFPPLSFAYVRFLIAGIIILLGKVGIIKSQVWGILIIPPIMVAFSPGAILWSIGIRNEFLQLIVSVFVYFLIGSLMGWIVGKIKSK